jgi:LacI family transcriptional regulator
MNVTMKDIAQELGVSIGTVSKVLRDHPDISEETRKRVRTRMQELNYHPNLAARALVTGRTYTIGLIVPDLGSFFGEVAGGLSRLLCKNSYCLIISSSDEGIEQENRAIEHLLGRRVDALILASCQRDSGFCNNIERQNTPFVLIDRQPQGAKVNFVGVKDEEVVEPPIAEMRFVDRTAQTGERHNYLRRRSDQQRRTALETGDAMNRRVE